MLHGVHAKWKFSQREIFIIHCMCANKFCNRQRNWYLRDICISNGNKDPHTHTDSLVIIGFIVIYVYWCEFNKWNRNQFGLDNFWHFVIWFAGIAYTHANANTLNLTIHCRCRPFNNLGELHLYETANWMAKIHLQISKDSKITMKIRFV